MTVIPATAERRRLPGAGGRGDSPLLPFLRVAVASAILLTPIDFSLIGLSRADGIDTGRWLSIVPFLAASLYLLVSTPGTRRLMTRGPSGLFGLWLAWVWVGLPSGVDQRQTLIAAAIVTMMWIGFSWYVLRFGIMSFGRATVACLAGLAALGLVRDLAIGLPDGRMLGLTLGTNDLAISSAVGMVWALILYQGDKRKLWLLATALFSVTIVGSGARTATVATAAVVLLLLGRSWRVRAVWLGTLIVAGALLLASPASQLFVRDQPLAETTLPGADAASTTTFNGRLKVWVHALELVQDRPITGHGIKSGTVIWEQAYLDSTFQINAGHTHNMVAELSVATGIVGLALFVAAMAVMTKRLWRGPHPQLRYLVGLLLLLGLTEAIIEGPTTGMIQIIALSAAASAQPVGPGSNRPVVSSPRVLAATSATAGTSTTAGALDG